MIAKGQYAKGGAANRKVAGSKLKNHFKYIEYRKRDESGSREDRSIFSKDNDHVSRKDAIDDVMAHTSQAVSYHKIMLSPGEDEPVQDWKQWTHEVMADLERSQGKELHWYAVHHHNTEHPHVHIVVAGAGENRETGQDEAVRLYKEDYQQIRESGRAHSDYEFYHQLDELVKELDKHDDIALDPVAHDQGNYSLSTVSSSLSDNHTFDRGDDR
jgi:hypothetical protein